MAGRIPQSFINDLLARIDIVDVIDARVQLKKAGRNYQALCPFHDEKSPSFSVSPEKQFYHCFGCGVSGTALTFLLEHDRLEFVEAVETLAKLVGVEVPREGGRGKPERNNTGLFDVLAKAEQIYRNALKTSPAAIDYLRARGLTGMVARDFGIGFAPEEWQTLTESLAEDTSVTEALLLEAGLLIRHENGRTYDRFRGRVMFPIRDTRGRVIGFGGRVLGTQEGPKYLNSPETPIFHKGRELYGLFEARQALRRIDRLIVVEGYMDVVALAQAGIANGVATLGTAATAEHFHKLYRYASEVVCCFDGDRAGRQAAWRALENALPSLTDGRQLRFMFLPDGEDPDSLVRKEGSAAFNHRVASASPAIEYLFNRLAEGLDLQNLDGQAQLASLAFPLIERVPEGVLKQLMTRRLESLTGFSNPAAGRGTESGGAGPRTPVPALAARQPGSAGPAEFTPLTRRLLSIALREPGVVASVDRSLLSALAECAGPDVFVDVVNYIDKNPETELSELLGRWAGHPAHGEIAVLAARPLHLDQGALAAEFTEGVARYVEQHARRRRRSLLAQMKDAPSTDKLQEFWALRRGGAD
ncbi:MAG: DNA primase [Pseudomonadales bacterium]|nr:DNA primase [Pseudomonadales bacterium]